MNNAIKFRKNFKKKKEKKILSILSMSNLTTSVEPIKQAAKKGVLPSAIASFGLISFFSRRNLTTSTLPNKQAAKKGGHPKVVGLFISTLGKEIKYMANSGFDKVQEI